MGIVDRIKTGKYLKTLKAGDKAPPEALAEAKTALKEALELRPGDPVVLFNYGAYSMNSGDPATAETVFAELVELKPDDALAHYQLGMVKVSLAKNDEAIEHMKKYLELEPEGANAATAQQILDTLSKN